MELKEIRKEIDSCDSELVRLLIKRMDCSTTVAQIKKSQGLPIYHPQREKEIIEKVRGMGEKYGDYIAEIYSFLMSCSRELQGSLLSSADDNKIFNIKNNTASQKLFVSGEKVACYGAEGSFSHLALSGSFNNAVPVFCDSFSEVFEKVNSKECKFGFVPVENSSAGSVREVYDLILEYKSYIILSVSMPVTHNLLTNGVNIDKIKTVYSHPQALSQCEKFLKNHGIKTVEFENTASAARFVSESNDGSIAAIGSTYSAKKYGLKIVAESIQSFDNNKTRFILISDLPCIEKDSDKISLVFSTPHEPGALQKILTRFALHGLNLTKLESRAGKSGDFETQFYLDFTGNIENADTQRLLNALAGELKDFTFLGNYCETCL